MPQVPFLLGDNGNDQSRPGGEGQLDLEYMMALAPGADTFYYSFSDLNPFNAANEGAATCHKSFVVAVWPPLLSSISRTHTRTHHSRPFPACASLTHTHRAPLSFAHTRTHHSRPSPACASLSLCRLPRLPVLRGQRALPPLGALPVLRRRGAKRVQRLRPRQRRVRPTVRTPSPVLDALPECLPCDLP